MAPMPTSAPGSEGRRAGRARQRGLTLVEVLAVIALGAVMTAVALTTVPRGGGEAEAAARAFAREVRALSDAAVVGGRTSGLSAAEGLSVHAYDDGWTIARALAVPEGVAVALSASDELLPADPAPTGTLVIYRPPGEEPEEEAPPPPVLFGPTGEVTPFEARFEDDDDAWMVTVGPFGETAVSGA